MKRRRTYRDTTPERASLSNFGTVLNTITDRREIAVAVLIVEVGLSLPEAARRLRLTEPDAQRLFSAAFARLRHPSRSQLIAGELDGDFVTRSAELRRWVESAAETLLVVCPSCLRRFLPESILLVTGGRPQRYCSNACRQRAYRRRRKEPSARMESGGTPKSSG
ncbi:hypothetical protein [Streptomyces sp. NPDC045470]|uniref:hypothetical protein n=1 Tax=Streptomyces sp. NPDC045470 TaxID=3155469 RepID=UPI003407CBDE